MIGFVVITSRAQGAGGERSAAAEAFVLMTLGVLGFVFVLFGIWVWWLWRRHRNPPEHVKLLMELDDQDREGTVGTGERAWERDAGWWKENRDAGGSRGDMF